jgi:BlaI family transcriptional regulator, penicillinase repressor
MNEQYEITEAELEIMQVLWKNKRGNLTTIMEELSKKSKNEERNKNTIKTLIHRLIQKGAIESQKVNNKEVEYIPKINEKKFIAKESNSFLNKFFNGNTEKLLLNFVENKKVTKNELQKLIDILEQDEE